MSGIGNMVSGWFGGSNGAGYQAQGMDLDQQTAQQGADQLVNARNQEQTLAQQLAAQANGQGIANTLAQNQLTAATGQNIKNAAGVIAGTKGINPALAARLAGEQATQANQMAGNESAQNAANIAMQSQGQLGGVLGNMANQSLNEFQTGQGGINSANNANAGIANTNAQGGQNLVGNIFQGAGMAVMPHAKGGMILPHYAEGTSSPIAAPTIKSAGDQTNSFVANFLKGASDNSNNPNQPQGLGKAGNAIGQGIGYGIKSMMAPSTPQTDAAMSSAPELGSQFAGAAPSLGLGALPILPLSKGGKVPAMVSPGEVYLNPEQAKEALKKHLNPMKLGEKVPGKAKVKGDSYKNDIVRADLDVGGIVIPRHITESKDAPQKAAKFVAAVMAHNKHKAKRK